MDTWSIIFLVALIAVFVLGVYVLPQWRFKRAVRQVIAIFRHHSATTLNGAKTLDELGLNVQRTFLQSLLRGRDFKTYALSAMVKGQIVQQADENRFYLADDKLPAAFR